MTTILTRDWTGVNGQSWTTVGWEEIVGGTFEPVIQGGVGYGPGTGGTDLLWRATGFPQVTGYKVLVDATWFDAAGTGRILGILIRCLESGQTYSLDIDSNTGTTRVRIRRRASGGAWSDLSAWASPAGVPSSAQLNAGVTLKAVVQNDDEDQVTLTLYYGSNELATYTDTSASRIESGGGAGLFLDSNWTDDDITVDNFLVQDFEDDWSGSGSLSTDAAISVDGTWYSYEDLKTAGITPRLPRDSIGDANAITCVFETGDRYHESSTVLYAGAFVKVAISGTIIASGRLGLPRKTGSASNVGQEWELIGPTRLAADVVLTHPDTGENIIRWNLPTDHVEYDASLADQEIGEAIAYILDNHVDGDGNLREQGAAPPDEDTSPYVQAQLDAMDAIVPELSATGDPFSAIESILSNTKYVLRIDPDTLVWTFIDRTGGTQTDVDQASDHIEWELEHRLDAAYTRFTATGARPEVTNQTFDNDAIGGIDEGWEAAVEAGHDSSKNYKNRDSGSVGSIGTSGGKVTMTPASITMDADEWLECIVEFTSGAENGNQYSVFDNSGTTFTLDAAAWISGGPAPGDTFTVYGNRAGGGRDNGHREVGRRWTLSDVDQGIQKDACAFVTIVQNGMEIKTKAEVYTPDDVTKPAEIITDLPSIGLVNYGGTIADVCTEGDAQATTPATVTIEVPTYSRSAPAVPKRTYPTSGFTGSAYTYDSGKWAGGGKPGRGDPSVMRTYNLPVPGYDGSASMQAEIDTILQALAAVLSPVPRQVRCVIKNRLDTTWIGLNRRLTISNTGGSNTGLESADDLFVYAVEYDILEKTTTIYAGTQGYGDFSPEGLRRALIDRRLQQLTQESRFTLDEIMACLASKPQETGQIAPTQICGDQIAVPAPGGGSSTLEEIVMRNVHCTTGTISSPDCSTFPCTGSDAATILANFAALSGRVIGDQKTVDFDVNVDDTGAPVAAGAVTIMEMVTWLTEVFGEALVWVISVLSSHDQELAKSQTDLASIRTNFTGLVTCINNGWAAIDACLQTKRDGEGVGCEIVDCSHDFTETVCEDPCLTSPAADSSTPPDCGDQGGE